MTWGTRLPTARLGKVGLLTNIYLCFMVVVQLLMNTAAGAMATKAQGMMDAILPIPF